MPIIEENDSLYHVCGGTQVNPKILHTVLGGKGAANNKQPEGAKNTEQANQPDSGE